MSAAGTGALASGGDGPGHTLLIGYNEQMKVAVVSSAAIWPILFNSRAALRRLDPVAAARLTDLA